VSDAEAVRAAAAATLAAGSARVRQVMFFVPDLGVALPPLAGLADLRKRVVRASGEGDEVLFGRGRWRLRDGEWRQGLWVEEGELHASNPLWIVAALAHADRARREDEESFAFAITWERLPPELGAPLGRRRAFLSVGRVWVDEQGLIRRVTATRVRRWRRRRLRPQDEFLWTTLELWDFGVDVGDLPSPAPQPEPQPSFGAFVRDVVAVVRALRR